MLRIKTRPATRCCSNKMPSTKKSEKCRVGESGNKHRGSLAALVAFARAEALLLILVLIFFCFAVLDPRPVWRYHELVEWQTIAALAGLLVITTGLKESGYLNRAALGIIGKLSNERSLALLLVLMAALLSMLLTNDIALFITVPLTLSLQRLLNVNLLKLIVFEALAVNAGSALTPIGNPQNLFLWQHSQESFLAFTYAMLPLELILLGLLLVFTRLSFKNTPLSLGQSAPLPDVDKKLLGLSLAFFPAFLVLLNLRIPEYGLIVILPVYLFWYKDVLKQVDWPLILIFILMFIDLRLIAEQPVITQFFTLSGIEQRENLFIATVLASQLISNVPAAILLAEYSSDWRTIAYAVNVAGNGIVIGSLANLIALRLARDKKIWRLFHVYSVPFLLLSGAAVYGVLFCCEFRIA